MRILVVDDHADTAALMARVFRGDGYDVRTVATADDALAACDETDFDLITCDVALPGCDGWELLGRVHARRALHAIAVTAYGSAADVEHSRLAGFDVHLTKPVELAALRAAVASLTPPYARERPARKTR